MPVHAAPDDVTLVSRQSDAAGGAAADNESTQPDISANGRYVVFTSNAQNLGPTPTCPAAATCKQCGDLEGDSTLPAASGIFGPIVHEIWLRDLQTNTLTLVSRADGENGAPGNGCAVRPAVSSNGRYVVFEASAPNLSPEVGDNWAFHIFLRDTVLNTTTLVDRTSNGGVSNLHSLWGSVSDDGRYVAFNSHSPGELTADELNTTVNTYVRDLQEQTTVLVSRASGANGVTQDADSYGADISGDPAATSPGVRPRAT
jgi:Tol biopolymer transport system component